MAKRTKRTCAECGKVFYRPLKARHICCSEACRIQRRQTQGQQHEQRRLADPVRREHRRLLWNAWRARNRDQRNKQYRDRYQRDEAYRERILGQVMQRYWETGGNHQRRNIPQIVARDGWGCAYCGIDYPSAEDYHVDHVHPVTRAAEYPGWVGELANLCLACPSCNRAKANKTPQEWLSSMHENAGYQARSGLPTQGQTGSAD